MGHKIRKMVSFFFSIFFRNHILISNYEGYRFFVSYLNNEIKDCLIIPIDYFMANPIWLVRAHMDFGKVLKT
jgi:hypothetical protein